MPSERHAPRPRFDTLFADARHYRGDCRLLVTAIRRGWLKDAPQADRDALSARFNAAVGERWAADPKQSNARALIAECWAMLAMDRDNTDPLRRLLRYSWACEVTDRITGRPRSRWHVSDHPDRLDAAAMQREQAAAGVNLSDVRWVTVKQRGHDWERTDTAALVAMPDRFRRVRLWLICPACGRRRAHLYATRAGIRCRECGGIVYPDRHQRRGQNPQARPRLQRRPARRTSFASRPGGGRLTPLPSPKPGQIERPGPANSARPRLLAVEGLSFAFDPDVGPKNRLP